MDGLRSMRQQSQAAGLGGGGGGGQYGYTTYPPPQLPSQPLPPQAGQGGGQARPGLAGQSAMSVRSHRRPASSATTGYSSRKLAYFGDRAAPRSSVTIGRFDLSCCTCGCWRFLPNGPLLLFMSFLVTTAYILSLFSIFSCQFFYRACYDGTGTQVPCAVDAVFENEMHLDGYLYGLVSYLPAQNTDSNSTDVSNTNGWGQCEWYPNEFQSQHTDSKFTMGKYFALFVLVCGGFGVISMALKLCITARRGQFLCAGIYLFLVFLFQSLSFIILASEYCVDPPTTTSDEFYPKCYMDTASYYSIAAACCWFASSMLCFLFREFAPGMRERKSIREMDRIADAERVARKNREKVIKQQEKEAAAAEAERIAIVEAANLELQRQQQLLADADADDQNRSQLDNGDDDVDYEDEDDFDNDGRSGLYDQDQDMPMQYDDDIREDEELGEMQLLQQQPGEMQQQQQQQLQQQQQAQSQAQSQAPSSRKSRSSRRLRSSANQSHSGGGGVSVVSSLDLDEESKYDEDERVKRTAGTSSVKMSPQSSRPNVAANALL